MASLLSTHRPLTYILIKRLNNLILFKYSKFLDLLCFLAYRDNLKFWIMQEVCQVLSGRWAVAIAEVHMYKEDHRSTELCIIMKNTRLTGLLLNSFYQKVLSIDWKSMKLCFTSSGHQTIFRSHIFVLDIYRQISNTWRPSSERTQIILLYDRNYCKVRFEWTIH